MHKCLIPLSGILCSELQFLSYFDFHSLLIGQSSHTGCSRKRTIKIQYNFGDCMVENSSPTVHSVVFAKLLLSCFEIAFEATMLTRIRLAQETKKSNLGNS